MRDDERAARAMPLAAGAVRAAASTVAIAGSVSRRRHAPNSRPDASESRARNRARRIDPIASTVGKFASGHREEQRESRAASASPRTPPTSPSTVLSSSTLRTMLSRLAPSAERIASSLPAALRARELEVRDVRARDEQQHADRSHQHRQHVAQVADEVVLERTGYGFSMAGLRMRIARETPRSRSGSSARCRRALRRASRPAESRDRSLIHRPVDLVRVNRSAPAAGSRPAAGKIGTRRQHADHGVRLAVDRHGSAERVPRAAEPALPVPIRENHGLRIAERSSSADERPPDRRRDAQRRQKLVAHVEARALPPARPRP